MREKLVELILARLDRTADEIREDFHSNKGIKTRFTAIDDLLPNDVALKIFSVFPPLDDMRLLDSFRDKNTHRNRWKSMIR